MPEYRSRIEAAYKTKCKSEVDQFPQDSIMPSHVGGTILCLTEFRDALMLLRAYQLLATGVASRRSLMSTTALTEKRVDWAQLDTTKFAMNSELYRCMCVAHPMGTKTHVPCASSSSESLNADRGDL